MKKRVKKKKINRNKVLYLKSKTEDLQARLQQQQIVAEQALLLAQRLIASVLPPNEEITVADLTADRLDLSYSDGIYTLKRIRI